MPPNEPLGMTPEETLKATGWRKVISQRSKYGMLHYWDHPDHQRWDGLWHTQGDAIRIQKGIDKAWITRKRNDTGRLRQG